MLEDMKYWRVWLLAIVVFLIIEFPIVDYAWPAEFKVDDIKMRPQTSISFRPTKNIKIKWSHFNTLTTKYQFDNTSDFKFRTSFDENFDYQTKVMFTIKW